MAREIDLTKKLSAEDRKYLEDRDRWRDIQANVDEFGGEPPRLPKDLPQTGSEATQNALGPGALTPEQQEAYRKAQEEGEGSDEEIAYEKMTKAQLQEELDTRAKEAATDEERENLKWKASDGKETLVAKLDKDDELVAARPE